ncbi:hypothetical protein, partial [Lacticaseibacillus suibinensis]|uniref:hypothetical protein n=1 Tax=Lacticaseibacillus suibinensis TaxID=2486011 RepID=UPI0019437FE6
QDFCLGVFYRLKFEAMVANLILKRGNFKLLFSAINSFMITSAKLNQYTESAGKRKGHRRKASGQLFRPAARGPAN